VFADALRSARIGNRLSVTRVAELAGTSRSAITEYEAGRKQPRFDTAERILAIFGQSLVPVAVPLVAQARIDTDVLDPLSAWLPGRDAAIDRARRDLAVIVEADAVAERLDVTWGQVKTVVEGITVTGDELSVWRLRQLKDSAASMFRAVEGGNEPQLRVIARGTLIDSNTALPAPRRALDFLVRATALGADPAFTRHLAGGFLIHHGYPWLWIHHNLGWEYRRALVACMRQGEGNLMASILISSMGVAR